LNGDGRPDIVTTDYGQDAVSVLLNQGGGSFRQASSFASDQSPVRTAVADVNQDGRPDLVSVSNFSSATSVLLGKGDGSFQAVTATTGVGLSNTPLLADFNGDGVVDSVVLDRSGNILFRRGLSGAAGAFAPPVILNPGRPARDITVVPIGSQFAIAAADAQNDRTLSTSQFVFTVSIYTVSVDGQGSRRTAFSSTALPTGIFAADLTGDGLADLIAINSLDDSVSIALQTAAGHFAPPITVPTGITPSDLAIVDENGDGLPDIVVSDQASGDVAVLLNNAAHSFGAALRFRASTSLFGMDTSSGSPVVSSFAQSVALVAGNFLGAGRNDLIVVNQATHSFTVLAADGRGGFANPSQRLTTSTGDGSNINARPGAIVVGDFNRDGRLDLAVLMEDTGVVWIYSGNGDGTFRHTFSIPVGEEASGLTVVPGGGDGLLNLLVGNSFGDVLTLEGKGDGTFQIQGSRVSLSVVPNLLGPGQAGVLVGNQQDNRVTVQVPSASGTQYTPVQTLGSSSAAQMAPGDVEWALLDRNATLPDAVVVSTGSNAVVVYRTIGILGGVPTFAPVPRTYFVGTAPAGLTVADLNGDQIPDMLIADQGSNDISVIFGSYDSNGDWVGVAGPRLKSGGDGPIAVTVRDLNGDSISDLAVVNGGSGTVTALRGVGRGFFDDQHPTTLFNLGNAVVQAPTFTGATSTGYEVTAAGDLVRFDLNNAAAGANVVFSDPQLVAAQALPGGQVVVALATGVVNVLVPEGSGLSVQSELLARGETPASPSAIQLVAKANGSFDVLVSSQGSDTISVFSLAGSGGSPPPVTPPSGGVSLPSLNSFQPAFSSSGSQFVILTASTVATSGSTSSASTSSSASTNSGALSATATSSIGLSLGGFSSLGNRSTNDNGEALLVAVEGNTYLSVPILDFGSGHGDELGESGGRMPQLQGLNSFGDTSPLTRFVIGLDEALRLYRSSDEDALRGNSSRTRDPWNEDLFYRPLPVEAPILRQEKQAPSGGTSETIQAQPPEVPAASGSGAGAVGGSQSIDEIGVSLSFPAARFLSGLKSLAGLFASLALWPTVFRHTSRPPALPFGPRVHKPRPEES
jgi:hypothetical protein